MTKKYFIFTLFVIFPFLVSLACLSSSKSPTPIPEEELEEPEEREVVPTQEIISEATEITEESTTEVIEEPLPAAETPEQPLKMLDKSMWIQEEDTVFVVYFFENPNSNITFEDIEYTFILYDVDDKEIQTDYSYVPYIFPNQTLPVLINIYLSDESVIVDSLNVDWDYESAPSSEDFLNPFTVIETKLWPNEFFPTLTGKIANSDPVVYTDVRANIVGYNTMGEIVGSGYSFIDFIPNEGNMGFYVYLDTFGEVETVEVFPLLTYSTKMIEDTDVFSRISVLNENFYVGSFGQVYGGAIIQNETNTVLENAIFNITFYSSSGEMVNTSSAYIDILLPSETLGISPWIFSIAGDDPIVDYDIIILAGEPVNNFELSENPFVINSVSLTGDFNDTALVSFTNTYSKEVSEVDVFVLVLNSQGEIIGGGNDWTSEPTPAGGTTEIEVWVSYDSSESVETIEVWVTPSFWTEFN